MNEAIGALLAQIWNTVSPLLWVVLSKGFLTVLLTLLLVLVTVVILHSRIELREEIETVPATLNDFTE